MIQSLKKIKSNGIEVLLKDNELVESVNALSDKCNDLTNKNDNISEKVDKLSGQIKDVNKNLLGKQNVLISGTDVKTINNESILGSGNIELVKLNSEGKIPSSLLPGSLDKIVECDSLESFPEKGKSSIIYIDNTTKLSYRWSGSGYVQIPSNIALGETSSTAYSGDKGKELSDKINSHIADDNNPHHVNAAQVGAYTKDEVNLMLAGKIDLSGEKGLSTNDYTTEDKTKLLGIEVGANVNVQSDWNEKDTKKDSYIIGKPTKLSDFTNDCDLTTSANVEAALKNYVKIGAVTTTKKWLAEDAIGTLIQAGADGYFNDIYISTNDYGKFAYTSNTNPIAIQINATTTVYIPYKGDGRIEFTWYSVGYVGAAITNAKLETVKDNVQTYKIDSYMTEEVEGKKGNFIKFTFSKQCYLTGIIYTYLDAENSQLHVNDSGAKAKNLRVTDSFGAGLVSATFKNGWTALEASNDTISINSNGKSVWKGLQVIANSGRFSYNSKDWIQCGSTTDIYIPCSGSGLITVFGYDSNYNIVCGKYNKKLIQSTPKTYVVPFNSEDVLEFNGIRCVKVTFKSNCLISSITVSYTTEDYSFSIVGNTVNLENLVVNGQVNNAVLNVAGEITHGSNLSDASIAGQVIPYFKEISSDEFEALPVKNKNVIYLVKE